MMDEFEIKVSKARPYTNEWKLFNYLKNHDFVSSRAAKYPPLEIMDLPKLISSLSRQGYRFRKEQMTKVNGMGVVKHYTIYYLRSIRYQLRRLVYEPCYRDWETHKRS